MKRVLAALLLAALTATAAAQVTPRPVPVPVPTPRPSPVPTPHPAPVPTPPASRGDPAPRVAPVPAPAPAPRPPLSRRQLEERRGDQGGGPGPTPTPAPAPAPAPAPGAPADKAKPDFPPAELEAAARRLEVWRRALRPARREHWQGTIVFLDEARKGRTLPIEMWIERLPDGDLSVRFHHGRLGDLPAARALSRSDEEGRRLWWRHRPEEGREARPDGGRGGPVPDLLADLVPVEPGAADDLVYRGSALLDARRILLFVRDGRRISLRPELNLVTRVEFLDASGEKALRELRFGDDLRRGLHRRFTKLTRHDFESGDSLRIDWEAPEINPDLPEDFFSPEALARRIGVEEEPKPTKAEAR